MTWASEGSASSAISSWCSRLSPRTPIPNTRSAPSRITGLSGCCRRTQPSPKYAVPRAVLSSHRLKDQGNRCRRANVVGGDLRRQRDAPAPVPHGMALHSLDEEVALARVVVRRRNGQRVKMAAPDVLLDPVAVEMCAQKMPQRRRVQQRPGVASAENCSEGQVHDPGDGIARLGQYIAAENVGGSQFGPEPREDLGGHGKFVAANR